MTAFLSWIDLIQMTIFGLLVISTLVSKIKFKRLSHIIKSDYKEKRRNEMMSDKKQIALEVNLTVPTTLFNIVKKNGISGLDLMLLAFSCGMNLDVTMVDEAIASPKCKEEEINVKDC